MKLAVTAASGQLGRTVIDHLKTVHPVENIIGIARTPEKAADLGVEVRQGSYGDRDAFAEALEGVEAVLLISATTRRKNELNSTGRSSTARVRQASGVLSTRVSRAPNRVAVLQI